jgi:transcriptional regulator with XRE-family HTH domain
MTTFGAVLAAYRRERGWSQYRLAEEAEIDDSYISRLETGDRMPGRDVTERLIVGFGLNEQDADRFRLAAGYAPKGGLSESI